MSAETIKKMMEEVRAVRDSGRAVAQKGGKKYTMVQDRIEVLRKLAGDDYRVETEIVHWSTEPGGLIVMKTSITSPNGFVVATGHAEEIRGASYINETSALENCETSSVGRALAILGIHGGEFASADEIQIAIDKREKINGVKNPPKAPPAPVPLKVASVPQKPVTPPPDAPEGETQVDIEEAIASAGGSGPASPASSSKLLQGVPEQVAGAVARMEGNTPVISPDTSPDLLKECFRVFLPLCGSVNEIYSFWHANEALVKPLKKSDKPLHDEIVEEFKSYKNKLTKKA